MDNKPICWDCKHGMCLRQIEKAVMMTHSHGEETPEPVEEWKEKKPAEAKPIILKSDAYMTLCYWNPKPGDNMPISLEDVKECNRYEKIVPKVSKKGRK